MLLAKKSKINLYQAKLLVEKGFKNLNFATARIHKLNNMFYYEFINKNHRKCVPLL